MANDVRVSSNTTAPRSILSPLTDAFQNLFADKEAERRAEKENKLRDLQIQNQQMKLDQQKQGIAEETRKKEALDKFLTSYDARRAGAAHALAGKPGSLDKTNRLVLDDYNKRAREVLRTLDGGDAYSPGMQREGVGKELSAAEQLSMHVPDYNKRMELVYGKDKAPEYVDKVYLDTVPAYQEDEQNRISKELLAKGIYNKEVVDLMTKGLPSRSALQEAADKATADTQARADEMVKFRAQNLRDIVGPSKDGSSKTPKATWADTPTMAMSVAKDFTGEDNPWYNIFTTTSSKEDVFNAANAALDNIRKTQGEAGQVQLTPAQAEAAVASAMRRFATGDNIDELDFDSGEFVQYLEQAKKDAKAGKLDVKYNPNDNYAKELASLRLADVPSTNVEKEQWKKWAANRDKLLGVAPVKNKVDRKTSTAKVPKETPTKEQASSTTPSKEVLKKVKETWNSEVPAAFDPNETKAPVFLNNYTGLPDEPLETSTPLLNLFGTGAVAKAVAGKALPKAARAVLPRPAGVAGAETSEVVRNMPYKSVLTPTGRPSYVAPVLSKMAPAQKAALNRRLMDWQRSKGIITNPIQGLR